MPFICIGPVCIPIWHLWVVLLFLFKPLLNALKYLWAKITKKSTDIQHEKKQDDDGILGCSSQGDGIPILSSKVESTSNQGANIGVHNIKSSNEFYEIQKECLLSNKTFIVDFTASWCGPCKKMAPIFQDLSIKYDGYFVKVDVDEFDAIAASAGAKMLPTFCIYQCKSGTLKIVESVVGADPTKLEKAISTYCTKR